VVVWRRRLLALVIRTGTFAASVRWILIGLSLAVLGVVGVVVSIPSWLNIAVATVSALLVLLDVRAHRARQRATQFRPRATDDFADVRDALSHVPRFEIMDFVGGTLVCDLAMSEAFASADSRVRLEAAEYVLPLEFRELGRLFQRRLVARSPYSYNDPVVGLHTNVGRSADDVPRTFSLRASRYWDYLASDMFAGQEVVVDGRERLDLGRRLVVDRAGQLRDFGDSWLLNGIGVSVLAVTRDGRYVVVTQSEHNDSAQGQFAPTGSGSLEPKDFRGAAELSLFELCRNGALREAAEEAAIAESVVELAVPLGFGRWLQKAAAPEFFLLAFLTVDSHELRRRPVPRADRPFTLIVEPRRFVRDPDAWQRDDLRTISDDEVCAAMSVPLGACLMLLADRVDRGDPAIADELRRRTACR
jgi:hypothetical protein